MPRKILRVLSFSNIHFLSSPSLGQSMCPLVSYLSRNYPYKQEHPIPSSSSSAAPDLSTTTTVSTPTSSLLHDNYAFNATFGNKISAAAIKSSAKPHLITFDGPPHKAPLQYLLVPVNRSRHAIGFATKPCNPGQYKCGRSTIDAPWPFSWLFWCCCWLCCRYCAMPAAAAAMENLGIAPNTAIRRGN